MPSWILLSYTSNLIIYKSCLLLASKSVLNLLPGKYTEKIMSQKDTCSSAFIDALFTTARTRKHSKCLSTEGWIKRHDTYLQWIWAGDRPNDLHADWNMSGKNKYHIWPHIRGIQKNGTDQFLCTAEMQIQR